MHRQAPHRTSLLTYEGLGHTAYPRTDCVRAAVETYLLEPSSQLPWRRRGCPPGGGSG
ncbi:alpha/beta hydrolase [Allokutzneria albata]|uniref:alpha/beta hydrolase n=1 Tax=Allokutzneria albata TaxID=211114 RepID=UPI0009DF8AAA